MEHLKAPQQLSRFFFLSLITGLYVLFIHQLTCHFISYNIMRVLLNSIKWSFNWKALLHFPIICSKLKADARSLIRIPILFPENQKSLSSCQDILQTQVNFEPPIFSSSSSSEGWTVCCMLIEVPLMDREIIALHITLDQGQCQDLFLINAIDM